MEPLGLIFYIDYYSDNKISKFLYMQPKNWYFIPQNQEQFDITEQYRISKGACPRYHTMIKQPVLSKHKHDSSYYFGNTDLREFLENYSDYVEISFEEFKIYAEIKTPYKIDSDLLNKYYQASNDKQRKHLVDNFKLDGTTTVEALISLRDIACSEWKKKIEDNHPDVFLVNKEINVLDKCHDKDGKFNYEQLRQFINIRFQGNLQHKGFYLSSKYNWEIVTDNTDHLVLVPTKK